MTSWQLQRDHEDSIENAKRVAEWRKMVQPDTFALLDSDALSRQINDRSELAPHQQIVYIKLVNHAEHIAWVFVNRWCIWVSIELLEPFRIPQLAGE